ncbi:hypothetical protein ACFSLT_10010 [Novosphingobium resinovorum]
MKSAHLILPVALTALALGGCSKKADDQPKAAAGGELLPRSVSDDMLPYDTVKSQASLTDPNAGLGLRARAALRFRHRKWRMMWSRATSPRR